MTNKLFYGIKRFVNEISGKEDYWHPNFKANTEDDFIKDERIERYYLDFTQKAFYEGELENSVPLIELGGKKTIFPITVFNYGIGLVDLYYSNMPEKDNKIIKEKISRIMEWAVNKQTENGAWINNYSDTLYNLKEGWTSGMGQGLGISFLIRCCGLDLISKEEVIKYINKAIDFMVNENVSQYNNEIPVIEEFAGTNSFVLNGFVFALFGLYDYKIFTGDERYFSVYEKSLQLMLEKYDFLLWTKYDLKGTISSCFYHNLHIEMMKVMNHITGDAFYEKFSKRWKIGLRFKLLFVLIKSFQKVFRLNHYVTIK